MGDLKDGENNLGALSDEALAEGLFERWGDVTANVGKPGYPEPPDIVLLWADGDRVWTEDLECDALEGNNVYVDVMGQWARISRGAFAPTELNEGWAEADPENPPDGDEDATDAVTLSFVHDGRPYRWSIAHHGDWLNISIVDKLNELIRPSGMAFCGFPSSGQHACVVVLTAAERDQIMRERGFKIEGPF